MRQGIRGLLQKAGDLDAKYAAAVEQRFGNSPVMIGSAVPIRDVFGPAIGEPENWKQALGLRAMDAAVLGSNVASRYALPVGGLTAAGVGLYELAQMLSTPDDQQSANQLYM